MCKKNYCNVQNYKGGFFQSFILQTKNKYTLKTQLKAAFQYRKL